MTTDTFRETPVVGEQDATMVQLLSPQGQMLNHPTYSDRVAGLDHAALEGLYRDMALVRRFDREATALQRHGELGLWPPCLGQEAAQIGSARALKPQDFVFSSYREHGVAYVKGLDLVELLKMYRGTTHGGWDPFEYNYATPSLVVGSHALHATGMAMGFQRDGDVGTGDPDRDRATISYFGDGATSQGDISEALVFAASNQAPTVFFIQNNHWAISIPASTQSRIPLYHRGRGFGIPSVQVDGNDVLACYAVTAEALERAHSGGGPTLIEAMTYRMGAHTTSDDPTRYRTSAEEEHWSQLDPLARLRAYLEANGTQASFFDDLETEANALGERTRAHCRMIPNPVPESMFDNAYASPHRLVEEERAWFAEYQAGFAEEDDQ